MQEVELGAAEPIRELRFEMGIYKKMKIVVRVLLIAVVILVLLAISCAR